MTQKYDGALAQLVTVSEDTARAARNLRVARRADEGRYGEDSARLGAECKQEAARYIKEAREELESLAHWLEKLDTAVAETL